MPLDRAAYLRTLPKPSFHPADLPDTHLGHGFTREEIGKELGGSFQVRQDPLVSRRSQGILRCLPCTFTMRLGSDLPVSTAYLSAIHYQVGLTLSS